MKKFVFMLGIGIGYILGKIGIKVKFYTEED